MAHNKGIGFALIGAGLLGAFALQGSARAESESMPPKRKESSRLTLARKWAKVFGVPASLILATIYVQSRNRANAYRDNKRGGAWGYGQMTLATAKEIWPRFQARIGLDWDGTGQGLLDPELNIALTAAYLSLWWTRYAKHPARWLLTACAYILGPGRVRKILARDNEPLPKSLPADFRKIKQAYVKALQSSEIKRVLTEEKSTPQLGAQLTGKQLAASIPATTTGHQAREMFGKLTIELQRAYAALKAYDSSLSSTPIKAALQYLDSTNQMLSKYYKDMPASHDQLSEDQLKKLRLCVSSASTAMKTIDELFGGTTWQQELVSSIRDAGKTIVKETISTVSNVIGLDKTSMALAALGVVGVGVLVLSRR